MIILINDTDVNRVLGKHLECCYDFERTHIKRYTYVMISDVIDYEVQQTQSYLSTNACAWAHVLTYVSRLLLLSMDRGQCVLSLK